MKTYQNAFLLLTLVIFTSCTYLVWQAAQLPGVKQVSDSLVEKEFVDWMESDPKAEVQARVAEGNYGLLGLAIYSKDDYWIPGVAGHNSNHGRYDVTWHGIGGKREKHIPKAEKYMAEFNRLMLLERREVKLDVYARGPKHEDHIGPNKT